MRFHVGQMVRIKSGVPQTAGVGRDVSGAIATVAEIDPGCPDGFHYVLDMRSANGSRLCAKEWALEPVYDGDQKISWSECAWRPQHLRETKREPA